MTSRMARLLLAGVAAASVAADMHDSSQSSAHQSVVDVVVASGIEYDDDRDNFGILYQLVVAADLAAALSCGGVDDKTIFAPTDDAFEKLAEMLGYHSDHYTEEGIFGYLASVIGSYGDLKKVVTDVLLYHVVDGAMTQDDIKTMSSPVLTSLLGEGVTIRTTPDGMLADKAFDLGRNPRLIDWIGDIDTCNGIVQGIDRVLIPVNDLSSAPDAGPKVGCEEDDLPSVLDVVLSLEGEMGFDENGGNFDILKSLVGLVGLNGALKCGGLSDVTVLAPTDDAFYNLASALGYDEGYFDEGAIVSFLAAGLGEYGTLTDVVNDVLLYHILNSPMTQEMMKYEYSLETLLGKNIDVYDSGELYDYEEDIDNPFLADSPKNVVTCNGFVQVIDGVLIPVDDLAGDAGPSEMTDGQDGMDEDYGSDYDADADYDYDYDSPCTSAEDCEMSLRDYEREEVKGCGNVECIDRRCRFTAWNSDGICGRNRFVQCGGDDSKCEKGPEGSSGTCTGYGNNECIYTWVMGRMADDGDGVDISIPPPPQPQPSGGTSVVDIALGPKSEQSFDHDWSNFDILTYLVGVADLTSSLQCGGLSDKTVLAPNDKAFYRLACSLGYRHGGQYDESAIVGYIADKISGYGDLKAVVTNVLLYHVVDGAMTQKMIKKAGTLYSALDGATIHVGWFSTLIDKETKIDWNARLVHSPRDIDTCNGYVQVIDRVLLPVDDLIDNGHGYKYYWSWSKKH